MCFYKFNKPVFSPYLNKLAIIFVDYLFGQIPRTWVFFKYLICCWVIGYHLEVSIQKFYGSYKFLVRPFSVIDAQHSELIIIGFLYLIAISLSGFFFTYGIMATFRVTENRQII